MSDSKTLALIPAYKPSPDLIRIVNELLATGEFAGVVVVNDGSGAAFEPTFAKLADTAGCTLLRHYVNLGKGAALKTGLNHCGLAFPDAPGVVTLDADGQHAVADAVAVARTLAANSTKLVLGCRQFSSGIPFRSRFGNNMTKAVMRVVGGLKLQDTQTGLRGIPRALFQPLLRLKTTGYDFELDMLLLAKEQKVGIAEVSIATIYLDDNSSSHFNPLVDSLKIYLVFLRFNLSSLLAVIIDYSVFFAALSFATPLLASQFIARFCAGMVNYFTNRNFVFKSDRAVAQSMLLYFAIVTGMGLCSYGLIVVMTENLGFGIVLSKILAELLLYFASFSMQRELVFTRKNSNE